MSRFSDVFGQGKVVLPVLHVETIVGALRNAEIAQKAGAPGIWIISHGMLDWKELLVLHTRLKKDFPDLWVGANFLDLPAHMAVGRVAKVLKPPLVQGLWIDTLGIKESFDEQPTADLIRESRQGWEGLLFGGVAFKYQREVPNEALGLAAQKAAPYTDVVVTSGQGTGEPAPVEKLRVMKESLLSLDAPLAVASGVTPENVSEILPWVDCILVATGVSKSFSELDPDKLDALLKQVQDHAV